MGQVQAVTIQKVLDVEAVAGVGTIVYSDLIDCSFATNFTYKIVLAGLTPDVHVDYQIIDSSEGDQAMVGHEVKSPRTWCIPVTNGRLATDVTATQCDGFNPCVTKWMRLKITGGAANGATTTVTLVVMYK
jgi:hypothetical protein